MCVCVCDMSQLICQCSGLFLAIPEVAAQNQAAINLQPHEQDAGGECVNKELMGKERGAAVASWSR